MTTTSTGRSCRRNHLVAVSAPISRTVGAGACGSSGGSTEKLPGARLQAAIASASDQLRLGKLDDAKTEFEKILDSDAGTDAHYKLGYIAQIQDKLPEAEQQYRAVIESDPDYTAALYNLAIIVTPDDTDEAISLYRRAIESNQDDANSHFNLGLLLRQQGKTAAGNAEIQTAVELNPALGPQAEAQGVPLE